MGLTTTSYWLLPAVLAAALLACVCSQGTPLQQIIMKICGERHLHVSEVVVNCAARFYGEKGMHMILRECLLAQLGGRDPDASLQVSPAAVEELCAWTNMSALANVRTNADADKVVPYTAGSTFYCALANLKITPSEYLQAYEECHRHYNVLTGPDHDD
ncbi:uncharacterized protein LOC144099536 [Amblyomma americanum]